MSDISGPDTPGMTFLIRRRVNARYLFFRNLRLNTMIDKDRTEGIRPDKTLGDRCNHVWIDNVYMLCMHYCVKVLMYECIIVWMNECDLFDCINYRWLYDCIITYDGWTRWNETKHVRWEAGWHRSTNTRQIFLGDDIIVNKSSRWQGKIWYTVATGVSWG